MNSRWINEPIQLGISPRGNGMRRISAEEDVLAVLKTRQASLAATRTRRGAGSWSNTGYRVGMKTDWATIKKYIIQGSIRNGSRRGYIPGLGGPVADFAVGPKKPIDFMPRLS